MKPETTPPTSRVWFVRWALFTIGAGLVALPQASPTAQQVALVHDRLHHYVSSPDATSARSGPWAEGSTWAEGRIPGERARVSIARGVTVTVDREITTPVDWINVEGTLRFQPDAITALTAHTIVVMDSGRLEIGTAAQPVTGKATLTLSSLGRDFDHTQDPFELTLGLIVMGQAQIHGQKKTAWVPVSTPPAAGASRLVPDVLPQGWQPGDHLVLTASTYGEEEDLQFRQIDADAIVVEESLRFARVFPAPGLSVHLGNLSRNVLIRSDPADAGNVRRQAHVMLMSHPHAQDIRYAEFRDLGRTTIGPVTDPRVVDNERDPSLCPPHITEENIRGRYALHFHHVGERTAPTRHHVQGVAIHVKKRARLKVGFINHSSNVVVEDSVGYNVDGSTFMTEEGNEIGAFLRNLAVSSFGSNLAKEDQPRGIHMRADCPNVAERRRVDMAHNGSGFWVHSAGVDVIGNVAAGHTNAGFDLWTIPLDKPKAPPRLGFEVRYLRAGARWPSGGIMPIDRVPALFQDNVAYAAGFQRQGRKAGFALNHGMQAHKEPSVGKSIFDGFLAWNVEQGIDSEYTSFTTWRNVRVLAGNRTPGTRGIGLRRQSQRGYNEVHGARVAGFAVCLEIGENGVVGDVQCADGTIRGPASTGKSEAVPYSARFR